MNVQLGAKFIRQAIRMAQARPVDLFQPMPCMKPSDSHSVHSLLIFFSLSLILSQQRKEKKKGGRRKAVAWKISEIFVLFFVGRFVVLESSLGSCWKTKSSRCPASNDPSIRYTVFTHGRRFTPTSRFTFVTRKYYRTPISKAQTKS